MEEKIEKKYCEPILLLFFKSPFKKFLGGICEVFYEFIWNTDRS